VAAGYRSNAGRWLGGASAPSGKAGYRSIAAQWLGGASAYTGPARPGYRSMLAWWLGGACSYPYVPPEPEEVPERGVGAAIRRRAVRVRRNDDDEVALLVATAWVTVCQD
jgi:hypothetical protein